MTKLSMSAIRAIPTLTTKIHQKCDGRAVFDVIFRDIIGLVLAVVGEV